MTSNSDWFIALLKLSVIGQSNYDDFSSNDDGDGSENVTIN